MNEYGLRVMRHYQTYLPIRYSQIEDPSQFFTSLGQQIEDHVLTSCAQQERTHASELEAMSYLGRVGTLNRYRLEAIEEAMNEFLPAPEPTSEDRAETEQERRDQAFEDRLRDVMDKDGMPVDPEHRLWRMLEDESVSLQQFRTAAREWSEQVRAQVERQMRDETAS